MKNRVMLEGYHKGLEDAMNILKRMLTESGEDGAFAQEQDLLQAVRSMDARRVRECIAAGADVNVKDNIGKTPLHWAALCGYLDVCKVLLDADADLNTRDKYGYTPLHEAALYGRLEVCKLLIDAGADVDAKTKTDSTPLSFAASKGHLEICELLLDAGADVNAKNTEG